MTQTVRMVTTAEHQYYGRRLRAGDEYDCEEKHVSTMQKMGWANPKPPAVVAESASEPKKASRNYRTRDMRAED